MVKKIHAKFKTKQAEQAYRDALDFKTELALLRNRSGTMGSSETLLLLAVADAVFERYIADKFCGKRRKTK